MSGKIIEKGFEAQEKIIKGVVKAAEAIETTLGPAGRCVAIDGMTGPEITRDGATVAKSISFKDKYMNMGANLLRKAAARTEEQAGDSTSTVSILTKEFCLKGQKYIRTGYNINEVKSGMLKAEKWMKDFISKNSIPVDGDLNKIEHVATISANNDPEVGKLVVECMKKVGIDGIITADLSSGLETTIDVTTGIKLNRGWASPQYVTSPEDGKCVMENPYILVVGERLSSISQVVGILEPLAKEGKPFLIVCDDIDDVVSNTLIINTIGGAIRCCVVKGIDFGDARKNAMDDLALSVGADYICPENNLSITQATLNNLGKAGKVIVSRDSCIIYNGAGDQKLIEERAEVLKKLLSSPDTTVYDKTKLEKRIANLTGGIGIIKAGGASEAEKLNRKATIEDSILASKSAISEGCVPGSGYVYYMGTLEVQKDKAFWKSLVGNEVDGAQVIFDSLPVIMKTVAENSGKSGDVVLEEVLNNRKKQFYGYNAKTKTFGNLLQYGVLDSAKSLRVALENSISAASMILLIDCTVIEDEDSGNNSLE